MNASHSVHDRASFQIEQVTCHSTESELNELEELADPEEREGFAVTIVSRAVERCLDRDCRVGISGCGSGHVLSIAHPGSHLSEMLPAEASRWILATRDIRDMEPLHFPIAFPETILGKCGEDFS